MLVILYVVESDGVGWRCDHCVYTIGFDVGTMQIAGVANGGGYFAWLDLELRNCICVGLHGLEHRLQVLPKVRCSFPFSACYVAQRNKACHQDKIRDGGVLTFGDGMVYKV